VKSHKVTKIEREVHFNENRTKLPQIARDLNGLQPLFCIALLFFVQEENILFIQKGR
jgi:hypothetical protein